MSVTSARAFAWTVIAVCAGVMMVVGWQRPDGVSVAEVPALPTLVQVLAGLGVSVAVVVGGVFAWQRGVIVVAALPPLHPSRLLSGFAVYLLSYCLFSLLCGLLDLPRAAIWGFLVIAPCALWHVMKGGVSWAEVRLMIGWHRGRGVVREIGAGLVGYLAALPLLALAAMASVPLARWWPSTHRAAEELILEGHVLLLLGLAAVFAPLVEETGFRGLLAGHLRMRGAWISIIGSGLIFALIHPQGPAALPVLTMLGATLATIRWWRGSLIASLTVHALHNSLVVTLVAAGAR